MVADEVKAEGESQLSRSCGAWPKIHLRAAGTPIVAALSDLIWVDFVVLGVIFLSALISVVRGFVKEALSLAGWIIALWTAVTFSGQVAEFLAAQITVPSVRQAAAFLLIFAGILCVTGMLSYIVGLMVEKTGLSGTDRLLGVLFGIGRGAVIVAVRVLLAGLTPLPQDPWWSQSAFIPQFESLALKIQELLPPDIAKQLEFKPSA